MSDRNKYNFTASPGRVMYIDAEMKRDYTGVVRLNSSGNCIRKKQNNMALWFIRNGIWLNSIAERGIREAREHLSNKILQELDKSLKDQSKPFH